MKNILIVFGTRPEAIKMAPLVKKFLEQTDRYNTKVLVTAQHRHMLDQVMDFFKIRADYDLDLMQDNQDLFGLTASIIAKMKPVLAEAEPDYVFVHGDTTTSFAAALAAFYYGAKVCHVEAGLRTYNKKAPFPEELNRQLTGRIADIHFAPTETARQNLLSEGVSDKTIFVTGNTVIDALKSSVDVVSTLDDNAEINALKALLENNPKEVVMVTGHRRENHGNGFIDICSALNEITKKHQVHVIYPVHLNPNVQKPVYDLLGSNPDISLIEPLSYPAFVWLMNRSKLVITDSGGVQEEAPGLGKPVLVMREITERPEAVDAGTVILVGTDKQKIVNECGALLSDAARYERMSRLHNPYGDGHASERILNVMNSL